MGVGEIRTARRACPTWISVQSLAPSAAQEAAVERLGAQRSGTSSRRRRRSSSGGFLATGVEGGTAVAAARGWLDANKGLFRLSSLEGLELLNDSKLAFSDGHAVSFRQTLPGSPPPTAGS